jgi:hypothetical protein
MSSCLTFTVLRCSGRSDALPPCGLTAGKRWETDGPMAKCALTIGWAGGVVAARLTRFSVQTATATHIELWGNTEGGSTIVLVPRKELVGMLAHKIAFNSLPTSEQPAGGHNGAPASPRFDIAIPDGSPAVQSLTLFVLCLWDPVHRVGLDEVAFEGIIAIQAGEASAAHPSAPEVRPLLAAPTPAVVHPKAASPPRTRELASEPAAFQRPAGAPHIASKAAERPVESPRKGALEDCVLVFSGYVNPLRGQLREKAVALGAKVLPDWDATATHLVCAAPHTPKALQVEKSDRGWIVAKEWLEKVFETKTRQAEAAFLVGGGGPSSTGGPTGPPSKKLRVCVA